MAPLLVPGRRHAHHDSASTVASNPATCIGKLPYYPPESGSLSTQSQGSQPKQTALDNKTTCVTPSTPKDTPRSARPSGGAPATAQSSQSSSYSPLPGPTKAPETTSGTLTRREPA